MSSSSNCPCEIWLENVNDSSEKLLCRRGVVFGKETEFWCAPEKASHWPEGTYTSSETTLKLDCSEYYGGCKMMEPDESKGFLDLRQHRQVQSIERLKELTNKCH